MRWFVYERIVGRWAQEVTWYQQCCIKHQEDGTEPQISHNRNNFLGVLGPQRAVTVRDGGLPGTQGPQLVDSDHRTCIIYVDRLQQAVGPSLGGGHHPCRSAAIKYRVKIGQYYWCCESCGSAAL
jgi:hypothetical protein